MTSEVEVIKALDEALSSLEDPAARDRVLAWACEKFATKPLLQSTRSADTPDTSSAKSPGRTRAASRGKPKSKPKPKATPQVVKDLDLKPQGKKSFKDFVDEKKPQNMREKCAVAVYYLSNELGLQPISATHVLTCFRDMGWRMPANMDNTLYKTASRGGWLETGDLSDIRLTTRGENLILHDLPRSGPKVKA